MFNECAGKYVGDKASRAVGTAKDAAGAAEEVVVDSAHTVYNKAHTAAAVTGDKAGSAIRTVSSISFRYVSSLFYVLSFR